MACNGGQLDAARRIFCVTRCPSMHVGENRVHRRVAHAGLRCDAVPERRPPLRRLPAEGAPRVPLPASLVRELRTAKGGVGKSPGLRKVRSRRSPTVRNSLRERHRERRGAGCRCYSRGGLAATLAVAIAPGGIGHCGRNTHCEQVRDTCVHRVERATAHVTQNREEAR